MQIYRRGWLKWTSGNIKTKNYIITEIEQREEWVGSWLKVSQM